MFISTELSISSQIRAQRVGAGGNAITQEIGDRSRRCRRLTEVIRRAQRSGRPIRSQFVEQRPAREVLLARQSRELIACLMFYYPLFEKVLGTGGSRAVLTPTLNNVHGFLSVCLSRPFEISLTCSLLFIGILAVK